MNEWLLAALILWNVWLTLRSLKVKQDAEHMSEYVGRQNQLIENHRNHVNRFMNYVVDYVEGRELE